jgi:hypothetical protein
MPRRNQPQRGHQRHQTRSERCTSGKSGRFESRERAQIELDALQRHSGRQTLPQRVYRCEHCGWWHLTSKLVPQVAPVPRRRR